MSYKSLAFVLPCLLAASAHAQSFNINFTSGVTSTSVKLGDSYGGAAGQAGRWNRLDLTEGTPKSLKLLNGVTSKCLVLHPSKPLPTVKMPDHRTCSTVELLLDSYAQIDPAAADITVSGMAPGTYRVWVYGRHPIAWGATSSWTTRIKVNGSAVKNCGHGPTGFCGIATTYVNFTHVVFTTVTVTSAGKLVIHADTFGSSPFGAINGVQVKCLSCKVGCKMTAAPAAATLFDASGGTPIGDLPVAHMQIHRTPAGKPLTIIGQAHRRDARAPVALGATATTIDIELWAGEGNIDNVNPRFARNYVGQRVNVIRRKRVSLPDWTRKPQQSPAPFDFVLKYDRPYRYSGRGDFVWELIQHSTKQTRGRHPVDAELPATSRLGGSAPIGVGCMAHGQRRPLQTTASVTTFDGQKPWIEYGAAISEGNAGAACSLLLGFRNFAFPLPLCRPDLRIYTDGAIAINGKIGANGSFQAPGLRAKWAPSLTGVPMFTQAATIDRHGLTVSNGVVSEIPGLPEAGPYAWVRAVGNPRATTGTVVHGAAMVTRILQ